MKHAHKDHAPRIRQGSKGSERLGKLIRLHWEKRQSPWGLGGTLMKMLIFLIFMALVIAGMVWAMRKSQAEADLARRQTMKRLKKQRNEAVTPQEHVVWPTIIRPVSGQQAAKTESKQGQPDEGAVIEEPSMTTIEYEPPEHLPA